MRVDNEAVIHNFCNCISYADYANNIHMCKTDNELHLYSYNTKIAIYYYKKDVTVYSTRYYSATTSKHQSILRGAINNDVIWINDVNDTVGENLSHIKNEIKYLFKKYFSPYKHADFYKSQIIRELTNARAFLRFYKRAWQNAYMDFNDLETIYLKILKLDSKKIELRRKKLLKKNEADFKKLQDDVITFDRDAMCNAFWNYTCDNKTFLHIRKKYNKLISDIEKFDRLKMFIKSDLFTYKDLLRLDNFNDGLLTFQGVRISMNDAKKLYISIKSKRIKVGDYVLSYRVLEIKDSYIRIGCHTFNIDYLGKIYELIS